jgi:hypothetical protein
MNNSPNNSNRLIIPIVLLVVGLGGGFVAGTQYQKGHGSTTTNGLASGTQAGANGTGGPGGMSQNGSMGTVTAISSSSISVKDQRASTTKTYSITSSTTITDSGTTATYSDISVGDTVLVSTSSSTSTTATQILINPTMGAGPGSQSTTTTSTN